MERQINRHQRDTDFLDNAYDCRPFADNPNWTGSMLQALYQIIDEDRRNKKSELASMKNENTTRTRRHPPGSFHLDDVADKVSHVIITIRPDEFEAVYKRFKNWVPVIGGSNIYSFCEVDVLGERRGLALARCHDQGEGVAQTVATGVVNELRPDWMFLVGIAGCVPYHEYFLGDVAISSWLHDFSITAALEGGKVGLDTRGGGMHHEVNTLIGGLPGLLNSFEKWHTKKYLTLSKPVETVPLSANSDSLYGSTEWRQKVADLVNAHYPENRKRPRPPKLFIGQNASSSTLVLDTELVNRWRSAAKNISTIEMELAGVYRAVADNDPSIKLLGIRGLSDVVGFKRNPAWTEYACNSAASFTTALIRSGYC